jgi:hypothetical protein
MEPIRAEGPGPLEAPRRPPPSGAEPGDFEAALREVDADLGELERLAADARRVASDEVVDPERFRDAVRDSEEALHSARRIRSRLLGAYRATMGGLP